MKKKVYMLGADQPVPDSGSLILKESFGMDPFGGDPQYGTDFVQIPHRSTLVRVSVGVDVPDPDFDYIVEVFGEAQNPPSRQFMSRHPLWNGSTGAGSKLEAPPEILEPMQLQVRVVRVQAGGYRVGAQIRSSSGSLATVTSVDGNDGQVTSVDGNGNSHVMHVLQYGQSAFSHILVNLELDFGVGVGLGLGWNDDPFDLGRATL